MTLHQPPTCVSEISAAPFELADAMTSAAKAIRQVLAGLEPESSVSLDAVLSAFRDVERVGQRQRLLRTSASHHGSEIPGSEISGPEIDHAYSEYRSALTEWGRQLPRLQGWLLSEQTRLRSRSNHARLVNAWMNADQQTR